MQPGSGGTGVFWRGVRGGLGGQFAGQEIIKALHHQCVGFVDALLNRAVFAHHAQAAKDVFGLAKTFFKAAPNQVDKVLCEDIGVFALVAGLPSISVIKRTRTRLSGLNLGDRGCWD